MRITTLALLFSGTQAFAQAWTQLPDFPGTARDDATAFAVGGAIYVGTGRDVDFALRNDWFMFDGFGEWTTIAAMPTTGRQYCSAFTDGQYGYVFGGVDANGPLNDLWRYDPMTDTWELRAPLPGPGRYASVAFDSGLICTGMMAGGVPTTEVWQYDPVTNTWTQKAAVPGPPRHRASGGGEYELISGGADAEFEALSDAYIHHGIDDSWAVVEDLPGPRYGADGANYVLVGGASTTDIYHNDTWVHFADSFWQEETVFPGGPRRGGVMVSAQQFEPTHGSYYYGTGVDLTERKKDWWRVDFIFEEIGEEELRSLTSYPNPTNSLIRFDLPDHGQKLPYEVFDITGRSISRGTLRTGIPLDASDYEPGRYIVIIRADGISYHSHFTLIP